MPPGFRVRFRVIEPEVSARKRTLRFVGNKGTREESNGDIGDCSDNLRNRPQLLHSPDSRLCWLEESSFRSDRPEPGWRNPTSEQRWSDRSPFTGAKKSARYARRFAHRMAGQRTQRLCRSQGRLVRHPRPNCTGGVRLTPDQLLLWKSNDIGCAGSGGRT